MIEAGQVEKLRDAVPRLRENARRPAGVTGLAEVLTPWFATYPQPQRSENEWEAWWLGYAQVCENCSTASLHGAMLAWAKRPDAEFLPKPGQLAAMAREAPTAASRDATHAWQVLKQCDDVLQIQRVRDAMADDGVKPEEQRQAVAHLLADFRARSATAVERAARVLQRGVKGADRPDAELPYIGGTPPKGHGITREMMRAMGWAEPPPDYITDAPPVGEPVFSEDM